MNANDIRREALGLPPDDRAKLASELLDSLEPGVEVDEPEWRAAWIPELQARVRSLEDGTEVAIPAEQVFEEVEAHLHQMRRAR